MSFSRSGSIITQSGTDADLSGLSGISGVTTVPSDLHNSYDINDYNIRINGTLTHDPENEQITNFNSITVNGTYYYGVVANIQGADRYSLATGLVGSGGNSWTTILANNGGEFNWNGGGITLRGGLTFNATSTVNITKGIITSLSTTSARIRQSSTDLKVNGLTTTGDIRFDIFKSPVEFNGYDASYKSKGAFQAVDLTAGGSNAIYEVRDFNGEGLLYIGDSFGGRKVEFFNLEYENDFIISHQNRGTGDPATVLYKELKFQIKDTDQLAIENAKYWFTDFDNGSRPSGDRSWDGQPDENFESDRVYTGATDVNGEANESVLTRIAYDGFSPAGVYDGSGTTDLRSQSNNNTDTLPVSFIAYNKNILVTNVSMVGAGVLLVARTLDSDALITQPVRATVDAYPITVSLAGSVLTITGNSSTLQSLTARQTYDLCKSYLCYNYAGEQVTIVTRSGFEVDGRALDINLSYINYAGDMTTTGVIALLNGATFNGTRTDANGTISPPITYSLQLPNILVGSRFQIYNETSGSELTNALVVSGGINSTYTKGTDYTAGDSGRYRVTYQSGVTAKVLIEGAFTFPSASAVNSLPITQVDDDVYIANAIDGSTLTSLFSADFVNNEIDILTATNFDGVELYAYFVYVTTTAAGILGFAGGFTAVDQANYRVNVPILNAYLNNNTATNIVQLDNVRIYRSDGAYPARNPTTGGGGIDVVWRDKIFIAQTGVSGLTSAESAKLSSLDTTNLDKQISTLNDITTGEVVTAMQLVKDDFKADVAPLTSAQTAQTVQITAIEAAANDIRDFRGLTLGDPATFTPTSITTSTKSVTITGDGKTTSTVTRNA